MRNPSRPKRLKAALVAGSMLSLIFSGVALGSSYWSTLDFTVAVNGAVRSYDRTNMNIELHSFSSAPGALIKTYTIKLYRHSCVLFICNDEFIGSVSVPRDGFGSGRWTNVGSGDYWFRFEKANDSVRVQSNDVHMFSN